MLAPAGTPPAIVAALNRDMLRCQSLHPTYNSATNQYFVKGLPVDCYD